nr:class I SAM-dependent methyltransferase [Pelotomaculum isophthalicicum]
MWYDTMTTYLDAVTSLGKGSLHPGGFFHTLNVLRQIDLSDEDIVLDIGCGTGRTACHIAKNSGAFVFALDNSEEMLQKATYRASQEGVQVQYVLCDAGDTPFRNKVIDLILVESVLIFLPAISILRECNRILKKNGILICVEMCASKSLPKIAREQIQAACNLPHIPSFEEWLILFQNTGFAPVKVQRNNFPGLLDNIKNILYPDPYQVVSRGTGSSREVNNVMQKYMQLIQIYKKYLGYGTFLMKKL